MRDTYRIGYSDVVAALLCCAETDCPHAVAAGDTLAQEWLDLLWQWVEERNMWTMTELAWFR